MNRRTEGKELPLLTKMNENLSHLKMEMILEKIRIN